jgi:hypothetical protein
LKDLNLDFVAPDLGFVVSGLDFVAKNLEVVAGDLDFLHPAGAHRPPGPGTWQTAAAQIGNERVFS